MSRSWRLPQSRTVSPRRRSTTRGATRSNAGSSENRSARTRPFVPRAAGEMEEARRFPADLAGAMAAAGLFRMAMPRRLGGLEVDAEAMLRSIELIGEADASAGWCVMIGATSALVTAYLPT